MLHSLNLIVPGGVERLRMTLFERLPWSYEHAAVCVRVDDEEFASEFAQHLSSLTPLGDIPRLRDWRRFVTAARVVRDFRPDIMHGAVIEGYTVSSIVGRLMRVPVVVLEETSDARLRGMAGHVLTRLMAGLADHCIAVSPSVERYLVGTLRVPMSKVSVIFNGVECPTSTSREDRRQLRSELGIRDDQLVVGSIGQMNDTTKRFDDLLNAFACLQPRGRAVLVLVGDGRLRSEQAQLAAELGIRDLVRFVGWQRDPGLYYRIMDIFALASEREAFGLVNAEAMLCGLPVVATRVGGIPDVVVDGETGILSEPRDIGGLARGLQQLIDDEPMRRRLGSAGLARAEARFSAHRYAAEIDDLYQQLLRSPGRRRRSATASNRFRRWKAGVSRSPRDSDR